MKVKSKYESSLVLEKIEIVEAIFRKKDFSTDGLELGVQVKHNLSEIENGLFELLLETTVSDKEEKLFVDVKGRAIFSTQQANISILEKNMIAIMFPYIRSYISLVSTQPGMNPIVLPAINVIAMLDEQK